MAYKLSATSNQRLRGVHPKLIMLAQKVLDYGLIDITVVQDGGVRTLERQAQLVREGKSKTLNSKHLVQPDGYGHAIDIAPFPIDWNDHITFNLMATLMFRAAMENGVIIKWGGHWKGFPDKPHFELGRKS